MSTALAKVETSGYLALAGGGEVIEAMKANMPPGVGLRESDLTRVKIPTGGSKKWTVPSISGDDVVDELTGILVFQCVRGLVWASDEPQEGTLPVLVTHDLKRAKVVSEEVPPNMQAVIDEHTGDDGLVNWETLPWTQWGSGKDGIGKRAKEQRVLYLLREQDTLPIIVAVQPGSLKDWQKFMVEISKAGIPYYRAVVRLRLEKETSAGGIAYSKVVPELVGVLEKSQADQVRQSLAGLIEDAAKSAFAG